MSLELAMALLIGYPAAGITRNNTVTAVKDNYTLDLPTYLSHIHNTFHVQLLTPYHQDTRWHRFDETTPDPIIDSHTGQPYYEIEKIIDVKKFRKSFKFFVKWKGYDESHNSWVNFNEFINAPDILNDFHTQNPTNIAFGKFP
jgi:hypothetical protein